MPFGNMDESRNIPPIAPLRGSWGGSHRAVGRGRGGSTHLGRRRSTLPPRHLPYVVPSQSPLPKLKPTLKPQVPSASEDGIDTRPQTRVNSEYSCSGIHPRLRKILCIRNGQKPLPTSECQCQPCEEYEGFIKVCLSSRHLRPPAILLKT